MVNCWFPELACSGYFACFWSKCYHNNIHHIRSYQFCLPFQAIDFMLVDALVKANNHLDIKSCIDDPAEYWKVVDFFESFLRIWFLSYTALTQFNNTKKLQLDDSIVKFIETSKSEELKESRDLIRRIRRRDLYLVIKMLIR